MYLPSLISVAYAVDESKIREVFNPVLDQVVYPIIYFIFALGVFMFAYGVIEMIVKGGDSTARSTGRRHILFGVIGMFIMISAWGIVYFVSDSLKSLKPGSDSSNTTQTINPIDPGNEMGI